MKNSNIFDMENKHSNFVSGISYFDNIPQKWWKIDDIIYKRYYKRRRTLKEFFNYWYMRIKDE